MSNYIWQRPDRTDWLLTAIFWGCAIPFVISSYFIEELPLWGSILDFTVNIIIDTISTFLVIFYVFPNYFQKGKYLMTMIMMMIIFGIGSVFYHYVEHFAFCGDYSGLTFKVWIYGFIMQAQTVGIFSFLLIGKKLLMTQKKMLVLEKEKKENELRMLQAQVDPHFLFNSLNILDVLIEKDPADARLFLKKLSSLYRYLLRHKDEEVIPLADELEFMENYIFLIKKRFGKAYEIEQKNLHHDNLFSYYIPPGSLQTLVENAIKHNQGDENNPVKIDIEIRSDSIKIENTLRPKQHQADGTKTGLKNLQARFRLLTDRPILISQNGSFKVVLPLLKLV